ncbi:hypothetical protein HDV06_005215 [Boothiomyces sp. JEL0866]|nr:hypothetical protein HDV06_005215 [Boothiomyces sp. JEL0866]
MTDSLEMIDNSNQWIVVSGKSRIVTEESDIATVEKSKLARSLGNFDSITLAHLESITLLKTSNMFWQIEGLLDTSVVLPLAFCQSIQNLQLPNNRPEKSSTLIQFYINWMLTEPLFDKLTVDKDLPLSVHSTSGGGVCHLQGTVDFTIRNKGSSPLDIPILMVVANEANPIQTFSKLITMAAVLHKDRKNRKACSKVYGIYTDGERWRFVLIDENSNIWKSKTFTGFVDELESEDLERIYQLVYFVFKGARQ